MDGGMTLVSFLYFILRVLATAVQRVIIHSEARGGLSLRVRQKKLQNVSFYGGRVNNLSAVHLVKDWRSVSPF